MALFDFPVVFVKVILSPLIYSFYVLKVSRQCLIRGNIQGVKAARRCPAITHLFFADDSLLFGRAVPEEALAIKNIVQSYEVASGQRINLEKSALSFSPRLSSEAKDSLKAIFEVPVVNFHDRYLGLPTLLGRDRRRTFSTIRERVWKKLTGWKEKMLSKAGKEILIKAVAQSIPTYSMSCFQLPATLCQDLQALMARFWWGHIEGAPKIHWVSWQTMCSAKNVGGMGFKNLQAFNMALLAKQGWRLHLNPNSLLARVMKGKYYPNSSFFEAQLGYNPSFTWRSIIKARIVLQNGTRWRVGTGTDINAYSDKWLPYPKTFKVWSVPTLSHQTKVCDLMLPGGGWNENLIRQHFSQEEATIILDIPLSTRRHEDKVIWHYEADGKYTVKFGYRVAVDVMEGSSSTGASSSSSSGSQHSVWRMIWKLNVPAKVKVFLWRACRGALPVCEALTRRNVPILSLCPRCGKIGEDVSHALMSCRQAEEVWRWAIEREILKLRYGNFRLSLREVFDILDHDKRDIFGILSWAIWNDRNRRLNQEEGRTTDELIDHAWTFMEEYKQANVKQRIMAHQSLASRKWQ